MLQVDKAVQISAPHKFVSREYRDRRTVMRIPSPLGLIEIGGDTRRSLAPTSLDSEP